MPVVIEVIEPIAFNDVSRYGEILVLSAEQRHYAELMFESEYLPRIAQIDKDHAARLTPMAERFGDPRLPDSRDFADFFAKWRDEEEVVCRAVEAADDLFFDAITATLSEEQQLRFPRVRWSRIRDQCVRRAAFPLARIDLSRVVSELKLAEEIQAEIDHIIARYEERFTPLRRRADQIYRTNRVRLELGIVNLQFDENGERRDPASPATEQILAEFRAMKVTLRGQQAASDSDCAEANESTFAELMSALPTSDALRLQQRFLARAYPRVYPDSLDPQSLMNDILGSAQLDADQREAMTTYWNDYRREYHRVCGEMERASRWWQEHRVRTDTYEGASEHNQRMGTLFDRRIAIGRKWITLMQSHLPQDARTILDPAIDAWASNVDRESPRLRRRVTTNRPD